MSTTQDERPPLPPEAPEEAPLGAGFDFSDPHSPLAPFYLRPSQVGAIGLLALLFIICGFFPLWHTDIWAHMKFGLWIVENGRLPTQEPFTPWSDQTESFGQFYTLSQLTLYGVYALGDRLAGGDELQRMAGGVEFLRTLLAIVTVLRMLLLMLAFRRLSGSLTIACWGVLVVVLLDLSNLAVLRPQVFGEFFFAIFLFVLSRQPSLSWRGVGLISLLLALWANTHGSFLNGLALIIALMIGRMAELGRSTGGTLWQRLCSDATLVKLMVALVLGVAAISVGNPHGPWLFVEAAKVGKHPSILAGVSEWQPLVLAAGPGWHWFFLGSLALLAITQLLSPRPFSPGQLLVLVGFALATCMQQRMMIWWAMVVPWVAVPHWSAALTARPKEDAEEAEEPEASFRHTILAGAIVFAALMWSNPMAWLLAGRPPALEQTVSSGTPWILAQQLKHPQDSGTKRLPHLSEILAQNYPEGKFTGTIFASPMQGDFLLWALAPQIPVSYTHMHLFKPSFWAEWGQVAAGAPAWWDILERYRVNLLIIEADQAQELKKRLEKDADWQIVLDETGDVSKPLTHNRQLIAVRKHPL